MRLVGAQELRTKLQISMAENVVVYFCAKVERKIADKKACVNLHLFGNQLHRRCLLDFCYFCAKVGGKIKNTKVFAIFDIKNLFNSFLPGLVLSRPRARK